MSDWDATGLLKQLNSERRDLMIELFERERKYIKSRYPEDKSHSELEFFKNKLKPDHRVISFIFPIIRRVFAGDPIRDLVNDNFVVTLVDEAQTVELPSFILCEELKTLTIFDEIELCEEISREITDFIGNRNVKIGKVPLTYELQNTAYHFYMDIEF